MDNNATISAMRYGTCWNRICQDNEGSGEELRRIIGDLSMAHFGFYAQEHHGGIYRRATGNGARYISVFADGETRDSGKNCWKYW